MAGSLARGIYVARLSIEYRDDLRDVNPDTVAQNIQRLMIARFGRSTALSPGIPVNPAIQTWRSVISFPRVWLMRATLAFGTEGVTVSALADVIAQAFREADPDPSRTYKDELAAKLAEGDSWGITPLAGLFGRVSMSFVRVASAPTELTVDPLDTMAMEAWQHATVRQGEVVIVPPPVQPSSRPQATPGPRPTTTPRPYGGTTEDPVIPDDPAPGPNAQDGRIGWGWFAVVGAATAAMLVAALAGDQRPQQQMERSSRSRR